MALDNTRFIVLSRDGNGLGNSVTNPNVYKAILLVDTTVSTPTDFSGDAARNAEAGKITTSSGVLDPSITALSWVEAVNLLNTNQLAKFNVTWDSGTNQVTKLTMLLTNPAITEDDVAELNALRLLSWSLMATNTFFPAGRDAKALISVWTK